jgi:hypothetical protein
MFHFPCINQTLKYANKQMHCNICDVLYAQYYNEHVSAGNSAIFRVMFLLKEYNCG